MDNKNTIVLGEIFVVSIISYIWHYITKEYIFCSNLPQKGFHCIFPVSILNYHKEKHNHNIKLSFSPKQLKSPKNNNAFLLSENMKHANDHVIEFKRMLGYGCVPSICSVTFKALCPNYETCRSTKAVLKFASAEENTELRK